jgi:hypothetical protein
MLIAFLKAPAGALDEQTQAMVTRASRKCGNAKGPDKVPKT